MITVHLLKTRNKADQVTKLESMIDNFDEQLPPLTTFILPGGGKTAAHLHLARSICRRAERETLPLILRVD